MASLTTNSFCQWIKLSPKQLISGELFEFPVRKLHKNNGRRRSGFVAPASWHAAMLAAFQSFTIRLFLYYTAALLWQPSAALAEFIVSSLKCCLGLLPVVPRLGLKQRLSPFVLFFFPFRCSSNIHFVHSVRPSSGWGDHDRSDTACCFSF